MKRGDWNSIFPNVPDCFHDRIQTTLEQSLFQKKGKRTLNKKILLTFVAVFALCLIGLGAATLLRWDDQLVRRFDATKDQQKTLSSAGAVAAVDQAVTKNGVTIQAIQTLGDKNSVYMLFEVAAPEGVSLSGNNNFQGISAAIDGADGFSYSGGFLPDIPADSENRAPANNRRYYELWLLNGNQDFNGKTIRIGFTNLQNDQGKLDMETIVEGDWNLSWALEYADQTQRFDINQHFDVDGQEVIVSSVELSPLSVAIALRGSGIGALCERANVAQLNPLFIPSITLAGGSTFAEDGGPGSEGSTDPQDPTYRKTVCFDKILDVSQATGVSLTFRLGNKAETISVPLTK